MISVIDRAGLRTYLSSRKSRIKGYTYVRVKMKHYRGSLTQLKIKPRLRKKKIKTADKIYIDVIQIRSTSSK